MSEFRRDTVARGQRPVSCFIFMSTMYLSAVGSARDTSVRDASGRATEAGGVGWLIERVGSGGEYYTGRIGPRA